MIKHIVAWDFIGTDKQHNVERLKTLLEELPELIPEIVSYEVGINIKDSENAKDMILLSSFQDEAGLQSYAEHPEHQRVVQELRKVSSKTVVVDFKV
ncbi:MAG: Dabb family protein [Candidatus Marinimicrobia bacterium]|jgi:quinol monooxygenase YgiN|nr:Dabb family protein [Candidatus Neomarinimicrobiota bacterium]MBT3630914.1 Dabb family protein [Candidatus Neomarinimicrobiota bacterium]MBT3826186.1 Dabb family protein [Candidatus Neomarinimicrobiota bacterium]MBT4130902.1 Dabb family protein [Candidatus Neomarinimicrobiota bacterium]MBT4295695.1 Dabb family protein [Candidatus Neomarinimicrobiota bacterium]